MRIKVIAPLSVGIAENVTFIGSDVEVTTGCKIGVVLEYGHSIVKADIRIRKASHVREIDLQFGKEGHPWRSDIPSEDCGVFGVLLYNLECVIYQKFTVQIGIPQPYMDDDRKWVLTYGISCRPLMPSAAKRLLSKTPLPIDKALVQELMISKEDIRLMKHYNMFVMV